MLETVQQGCISDTVYVPRDVHDTVYVTINPYSPPKSMDLKDVQAVYLGIKNDSLTINAEKR